MANVTQLLNQLGSPFAHIEVLLSRKILPVQHLQNQSSTEPAGPLSTHCQIRGQNLSGMWNMRKGWTSMEAKSATRAFSAVTNWNDTKCIPRFTTLPSATNSSFTASKGLFKLVKVMTESCNLSQMKNFAVGFTEIGTSQTKVEHSKK